MKEPSLCPRVNTRTLSCFCIPRLTRPLWTHSKWWTKTCLWMVLQVSASFLFRYHGSHSLKGNAFFTTTCFPCHLWSIPKVAIWFKTITPDSLLVQSRLFSTWHYRATGSCFSRIAPQCDVSYLQKPTSSTKPYIKCWHMFLWTQMIPSLKYTWFPAAT